jgi:transcriptional regulator NrdR family protein
MICPECQSDVKTYDTRLFRDEEHDFYFVRRKRRCLSCEHKFVTIEVEQPLFDLLCKGTEEDDNGV